MFKKFNDLKSYKSPKKIIKHSLLLWHCSFSKQKTFRWYIRLL